MFQHLPLAICLGWALKLPSRYTFTNCLLFFGSGKTKKTSDCIRLHYIYISGWWFGIVFFSPYIGNKSAPNRWLKGLGLLIFSVGHFPRKLGPSIASGQALRSRPPRTCWNTIRRCRRCWGGWETVNWRRFDHGKMWELKKKNKL